MTCDPHDLPLLDDCPACLGTGYFPRDDGSRRECSACNGTGRKRASPVAPLVVVGPLPNGSVLYRQDNGAGGFCYWSDEIGGGVAVWNTSLIAADTLLATLVAEQRRAAEERRAAKLPPITEEQVTRATLALLGKERDNAPQVDWVATRDMPISRWRECMRRALESVYRKSDD